MFDDVTILTIGLVLFAGAQVWLQFRSEMARKRERQADLEEAADRSFQFAWAEHFRLDALAKRLETSDLVEMTILGVLKPEDVLPAEPSKLTEALSALGREAGFLGGVAGTLTHDTARQIATYAGSVRAFEAELPSTVPQVVAVRVQAIHQFHDEDLAAWDVSIRKSVRELANLLWDSAASSPRATENRTLKFADDMTSQVGASAVKALVARGKSDK